MNSVTSDNCLKYHNTSSSSSPSSSSSSSSSSSTSSSASSASVTNTNAYHQHHSLYNYQAQNQNFLNFNHSNYYDHVQQQQQQQQQQQHLHPHHHQTDLYTATSNDYSNANNLLVGHPNIGVHEIISFHQPYQHDHLTANGGAILLNSANIDANNANSANTTNNSEYNSPTSTDPQQANTNSNAEYNATLYASSEIYNRQNRKLRNHETNDYTSTTNSTNNTLYTATSSTGGGSSAANVSVDTKILNDSNSPVSSNIDPSPSSGLATSPTPVSLNEANISKIHNSTASNTTGLTVDDSYLPTSEEQQQQQCNNYSNNIQQQQQQQNHLLLQSHQNSHLMQQDYTTGVHSYNRINGLANLKYETTHNANTTTTAIDESSSPNSIDQNSHYNANASVYGQNGALNYYNRNSSTNLYDMNVVAAAAIAAAATQQQYPQTNAADAYSAAQHINCNQVNATRTSNDDYLSYSSFLNNNANSTSPQSNSSSSYQTSTSPPAPVVTQPYIQYQSIPSAVSVAAAAAVYGTTPTTHANTDISSIQNISHRYSSSELMYNNFKTATNTNNNISFDTNTVHSNISSKYKNSPNSVVNPANTTTNAAINNHHHHHHSSRVHQSQSSASSLPVPVPIPSQLNGSPQDVPPNQLCAVCGDNAACQHYGVRTCEGCKGFFKRTVQKNSKYVCLADKNCPVDKRRRNRCQYCRFQKCLAVGMVKEVVRTNDLKGRRGRLPTKPKSPNVQNNRTQQSAFLSQIVRFYTDSIPNQTALDFSKYRKITKEGGIRIDEEPYWILQSLSRSCDIVRQWTEKFSTLCRIPNQDRDRMFFSNLLDLVILRIALRMQENVERIVLCNAVVFHKTQIACVLTPSIVQQLQDLGNKLKQPDPSIASLLVALVFLQDPQQISMNELYCKIRDFLKDLCNQQQQQQQQQLQNQHQHQNNYDYQQSNNYYSKLTELFVQLHQISSAVKQRLKQCSLYNNSIYPYCIPQNSILDVYLQSQDPQLAQQTSLLSQAHQSEIKQEILLHEFS